MSRWTNWLGPLDCTDNLKALWAAYEIGVAEMPGAVYKETGYQVAAFLHGLIPMLMQVLIALAATTALGGAIGALVGAFFGGAGAIPGGAIGAQAGFDLGVLILTWMGLAFLIEAIGHGLVELTSLLTQAVRRAWDAPNTPQSRQQIRLAGQDLARCGAILMRLILQGIVAWLSKGSAVSTFTRSEASMGALVAELRKSKLGPQFTGWIEANIERLMSDPSLRPHRGRASVVKDTSAEAQTPSQLRRQAEAAPTPAPPPAQEPTPPAPPRRPSWRESEGEVGRQLDGQGYREQVSFKEGQEVPYGTKGSTRPDYYKPGTSVEVKNYNVETAGGRSNLVKNVSEQAIKRAENMPEGTTQIVKIDVRGQNVSNRELLQITQDITSNSNGAISSNNIQFLR